MGDTSEPNGEDDNVEPGYFDADWVDGDEHEIANLEPEARMLNKGSPSRYHTALSACPLGGACAGMRVQYKWKHLWFTGELMNCAEPPFKWTCTFEESPLALSPYRSRLCA